MLGWIRCSVVLGLLELAQGDSLCVSPIHLATYRKNEENSSKGDSQMDTYKSADGVVFTDEDIEQWALEAESDTGYAGKHLSPSIAGKPISSSATEQTSN